MTEKERRAAEALLDLLQHHPLSPATGVKRGKSAPAAEEDLLDLVKQAGFVLS